jgi:asparagine synthase (glutamine-hydrolysing)
MANSIELRSPMLDQAFFTWSFNLSPHKKLDWSAGGKAILKRAMETRLPRDLLYRPKKGFTVPLARWFRGPLRDQVRALAESPHLSLQGAIRLETVRRMAEAHLSGQADCSKPLWLVWAFEAFLAHDRASAPTANAGAAPQRPMPALP